MNKQKIYSIGLRFVENEVARIKKVLADLDRQELDIKRAREVQEQRLSEYLLMLELDEKEQNDA